ncbi:MAG: hypothetical protein HY775_11590 [Acidobacteria bacterium]|nr:hypothetical protein [Acidobacteriota bacterium]
MVALTGLVPGRDVVGLSDQELLELGQWAVEARYPGDLRSARAEQARRAVESARTLVEAAGEVLARPDG